MGPGGQLSPWENIICLDRHFPAFTRSFESGFDTSHHMKAVLTRHGRRGARFDRMDESVPLADKALFGYRRFDRVLDRLPFEAAPQCNAIEEIHRQHAIVEDQFITGNKSAITIADTGDLTGGLIPETEEEQSHVISLLVVE
ncbi:Uncharacterised protein [Brucella suis]|nr:hypothetical protein C062_02453 [Brucella suis 92/29]ENR26894.1 hypothetical protein C965_02458 [Brucella suis CNGB 786]ENT26832.1 hypothetical protein B985_02283 [Brucella suis 01-5744]ENT34284.1 hypothetical protein C966_02452 [Brucella suis CNGB 247]KFJ26733.1 hypothetical protein DK66_455 [Brucella suis 1330]SPU72054.1 Uncharacterised protein [Brucella suis]